jgi:hypothetical protein
LNFGKHPAGAGELKGKARRKLNLEKPSFGSQTISGDPDQKTIANWRLATTGGADPFILKTATSMSNAVQ